MAEITISISGDKQVLGALNVMDRAVKTRIRPVLSKNGDILEAQSRALAREDTGTLKRSITKRSTNDDLTVQIKSSRSWWVYAEYGMGQLGSATGGKTPSWLKHKGITKMPYIYGRLEKWAKKKGLDPFAVSKGIFERKGVKAKPFYRPTFRIHEKRISNEIVQSIYGGLEDAAKPANIKVTAGSKVGV